jgi:two-component system chemotaxis sensor kinase CheA
MIDLDTELAECHKHLATLETDLITIETGPIGNDEELLDRAFRAVRSVKGGAGFFSLVKIGELAHRAEDALAKMRSRKVAPTPEVVGVRWMTSGK